MLPLCFVLMPFGKKSIPSGVTVDFDAVYQDLIAPAITAAGMEPLRADEEVGGGIIHKPMFERLILCDFAVADLTGANANVFYELGLRHGIRPATTVLLYAGTERMMFDVAPLRALPYTLDPAGRRTWRPLAPVCASCWRPRKPSRANRVPTARSFSWWTAIAHRTSLA